MNRDEQIEFRGAFHSGAQRGVIDGREIVDSAVTHEGFQADHAAIRRVLQARSKLPGTSPPQSAEIDERFLLRRGRFRSKLAPSIVGGWALSGMSKIVVVPPAAAAREPVANPSQSVRPGSLKWTCESITPGKIDSFVAVDFFTCAAPRRFAAERDEFSFRDSDVSIVSAHDQIEITHSLGADGRPPHAQTAHSAVGINV